MQENSNCKLKCGQPAMKGNRFADMCLECYLEHNEAIAMMHRSDK